MHTHTRVYIYFTEMKKNDFKELRSNQVLHLRIPKSDLNDNNSTNKGRKGREQSNSAKQNKRVKRTKYATLQKDKKDDARTYSRFLPLEDIKTRDSKDSRSNEQDYTQAVCMPIIP